MHSYLAVSFCRDKWSSFHFDHFCIYSHVCNPFKPYGRQTFSSASTMAANKLLCYLPGKKYLWWSDQSVNHRFHFQ